MLRENRIDVFDFATLPDGADPYALLEAGKLEGTFDPPPPDVVTRYLGDSALGARLHSLSGDALSYVTMNLTQPPFDDVHVRRAVNYIVDRQAMVDAFGPAAGSVATHIVPPTMTGGHPTGDDYDPFGMSGNLALAQAEMKQSSYDSNHDGVCDAKVCQNVVNVGRMRDPGPAISAMLEADLAKIGIQIVTQAYNGGEGYGLISDPTQGVAISTFPTWVKDYPDPFAFLQPLFSSSAIGGYTNNYSLVGLTPDQATALGITGNVANVPSIDDDIDNCEGIADDPSARTQCWVDLDKKLTTVVVPTVPILWRNTIDIYGAAVTVWDFDQLSVTPAWAHMDLDPALQK
jgi:ABC-type transport system substrate-binding protein